MNKIITKDKKQVRRGTKHEVKVITLSGVSSIGRNSYVVDVDGKLFVLDFGIGFPEGESFGVNAVLPDFKWLKANKKRIAAIVITHAHLDHVGGLAYVIDELDYPPVYGSLFAIEFLKEKLKEVKKLDKFRGFVVSSNQKVKVENTTIEFAHVTHSIPNSLAVAVNTPYGKVVYTGDYKFDDTPINDRVTDFHVLSRWAKEGVLISLLDSTNAFKLGHSKSETSIMGVLEDIIKNAQGRVIIGMFSSLVSRLVGIMEIAKKLNKKVVFTGRSLESNVKLAAKIGYLHLDRNIVIKQNNIGKYPDNQIIVISTGSQGEQMAALTRMSRNTHKYVKIKRTDTVILSSSVIPSNQLSVQDLLDKLARRGVTIVNSELMDVHVSGHAYQDELVQMAKLLNSKYYIPVHGYPSFLFQHRTLLISAGIPSNKIFVPVEGSVFKVVDGKLVEGKKIKTFPQFVIGQKILDTTDTMIEDRKSMAGGGHVVVTLLVSKKNVLVKPLILLKGVTSKDKYVEVVKEVSDIIAKTYDPNLDLKQNKRHLFVALGRYFGKGHSVAPLISVEMVKI